MNAAFFINIGSFPLESYMPKKSEVMTVKTALEWQAIAPPILILFMAPSFSI